MKRFLKKEIIIFIILLVMLFTLTLIKGVDASTTSGNYKYDNLSDGTISIVGYTGTEQNVIVPSTIDGKRVTTLGMLAFSNNNTVKSVILPEGLLRIEGYAFDSCPNLTTVEMPSSLNFVSNIFRNACPKLTNYTIPSTLTELSSKDYQRIANINISGTYNYDKAKEVVKLVNEERKKLNLNELEIDYDLMEAAMKRASETSIYWSHERPNGLSCFSLNSKISGENIGIGSSSVVNIMNSWMNSPGHKAQIVKGSYNSIGIGCYYNSKNGVHYWVQLFSKSRTGNSNTLSGTKNITNMVQVATDKGYLQPDIKGLQEDNTLAIGETLSPTSVRNKNAGYSVYTNIASSDLTWKSSNTNIFTVDKNGKITAKNAGKSILTASIGEFTKTFNIIVEKPIPDDYKIKLNYNTYQMNSTLDTLTLKDTNLSNNLITWSSTNEKIATVDSNGKVIPKNGGFTKIIATTEKYGSSQCWLYVCSLRTLRDGSRAYPGDLDRNGIINASDTANLLSWVKRTDLTQDEIAIGDLDGDGRVTANDAALATDIFNNGIGFIPGKYQPITSITLNNNNITLKENLMTITLNTTISPSNTTDSKKITWTTSNSAVAIVNSSGVVTGKANGTTIITAKTSNGKTASCRVTVNKPTTTTPPTTPTVVPITKISLNPTSTTIKKGTKLKIKATINPTNTTQSKTITWTTSNGAVATVSSTGEIIAKGNGTTIITAKTSNGKTASCRVTVYTPITTPTVVPITKISLSPTSTTIKKGTKLKIIATINPTNTTQSKTITWTTSNSAVATVSSIGEVIAKGNGTTIITAKTSNGKTASCRVTVYTPTTTTPPTQNKPTTPTKPSTPSKPTTSTNTSTQKATPSISYRTHVQNIGWQSYVKNGKMAGTSGRCLRLEGINIKLENNQYGGGISYQTHIQNIGWQKNVQNGAMSGTSGKCLRLEGIKIKLTGQIANYYDIYYRVHCQNVGWLDWAKNGEPAGSEGFSYRLEGIEICLVKKGGKAPGKTNRHFVQKYLNYQTHVQNIGWQNKVQDKEMSGTSGKSLRLEGIKITLQNKPCSGNIEYRTHVQNIGWQNFVKNGAMSGTNGRSLRLEAIQIRLTGEIAKKYDIYYRVHCQNFGWMGWAKNGQSAGSAGYCYRLEGIEICLVEKGSKAPGTTTNCFRSR